MFCIQYLNDFYNEKINNIENIKFIVIFLIIFSVIGIILSCLKFENDYIDLEHFIFNCNYEIFFR